MSWAEPVLHWLAIHTGTLNEGGPYYAAWSGWVSDIGEVAIIGGVFQLAHHHNCHQKGCWRIGRHVTKDGYKLCRTHVGMPCDDLTLHPIHPDHVATTIAAKPRKKAT